jgi:chromosome segregation ATPase
MWCEHIKSMLKLLGLPPAGTESLVDYFYDRIHTIIKERDELRARLEARTTERADMANTICDLRAKIDAYRAGTEFIHRERDELRAKLEVSQKMLSSMTEAHSNVCYQRDALSALHAQIEAQTTAPNQSLRNKAYALAIAIRNVTDTCDLTTKIEALFQD